MSCLSCRQNRRYQALVLGCLAHFSLLATASAQDPAGADDLDGLFEDHRPVERSGTSAGERPAASPLSTHARLLTEALRQAVDGSLREALQTLADADAALSGSRRVHYLSGEIFHRLEEYESSENAFARCISVSEGETVSSRDGLYARCLIGHARTLEAQPDKWDAAKTAWERYLQFAEAEPLISFPGLARARIEALEQAQTLAAQGQEIRDRIAAGVPDSQ